MGDIEFRLHGGACLAAAAALLLVPLRWLLAMLIAGAAHEAGHILAVRLCGGRILSFELGIGGAVIETTPLRPGCKVLCILAGPLTGLSLVLLYRKYPELAACALIQSGFNLLPLWPLDGGRILQSLVERIASPASAEQWVRRSGRLALVCLAALALKAGASVIPVIFLVVLLGKRPCKPAQVRVQ